MMKKLTKKDIFFLVLSAITIILVAMKYINSQYDQEEGPLRIALVPGRDQPRIESEQFSIALLELTIPDNPLSEDDEMDAKLLISAEIDHLTYTFVLYHFYYEDEELEKKYNCPTALRNHTFALEVKGKNVELVINKTRYDEDFDLELDTSVSIGDLTILFGYSTQDWNMEKDNRLDDCNTYHIMLTEGSKEEVFSFNSLEQYAEEEFVIDWQGYRIVVSEDYIDMLTMRVEK